MIEPSKLCFVLDTEGCSPLEIAVGTLIDGQLVHDFHALVKPRQPIAVEVWATRNVHGIPYDYAWQFGSSFEQVVILLRKYMLDQRAAFTEDPDVKVAVFVAGAIDGGDAKVLDALGLRWLSVRAVLLDPWLNRIHQSYFKDTRHPGVHICSMRAHHDYGPVDLAARASHNASAKAKLSGGVHCATEDIVRLANFLIDSRVI